MKSIREISMNCYGNLNYYMLYLAYIMKKYNVVIEKNADEKEIRDNIFNQLDSRLKDEKEIKKVNFVHKIISQNLFLNVRQILTILNEFTIMEMQELVSENVYTRSAAVENDPLELCDAAISILNLKNSESVLEIGSNIGAFLIRSYLHNKNINLYAEEIHMESCLISEMRLDILEAKHNICNTNSLFENKQNKKFDRIYSYPPMLTRMTEEEISRFNQKSSFEAKTSTDTSWLFIDRVIRQLDKTGKAVVVVNDGALFNVKDKEVREHFVKNGYIESIISLPTNLLYSTGVKMSIIVLSHNNEKIKFIDARNQFNKSRRINQLKVDEIIEMYNEQEDDELITSINLETIRDNSYSLNVERYVGIEKIELINPIKLKNVVKDIFRGIQISATELDKIIIDIPQGSEYQLLTLGDINKGIIENDLNYISIPEKTRNIERYLLEDGDLIISAKGTNLKIATVQISNERIIASGNLLVIRPNKDKINPVYLKTFFDSKNGKKILESIQVGSVILSINPSQLKEIEISMPNTEKQEEIAKKYLAKIDLLKITRKKLIQLEKDIESIHDDEI